MSKLSKGQRMIARAAMPFDKITGADFDALKKKKKKKKKQKLCQQLNINVKTPAQ